MYGDGPYVAAKKQLMEKLPTFLQTTHQQGAIPRKGKIVETESWDDTSEDSFQKLDERPKRPNERI